MDVRKFSVLTVLAALVGSLLTVPGKAAVPDLPLPSLSLDQVTDMFQIDAPPAGVGLLVFADFPLENPLEIDGVEYTAVTLDVGSDGGVMTRNAVPARGTAADEPMEECKDPAFGMVGKQWDGDDLPVQYSLNRGSIPSYMSPWLTTRSLREGHQVWGETNNKCHDNDAINFSFHYVGVTNSHIKYDGTNITDFGKLGKAVGVSYVWYTNTRIREVDMRLNKGYMWSNIPKPTQRYMVKNVVTHETGHHLGLDDLTEPHQSLTMYGVIGKGELRKTTLGRGDIKGAELLSP